METASVVASHIVQLLDKSQNNKLLGSQLSALVKFEYPWFKPEVYGCANLRQFISKNVPAIQEIDRAGADIIYGLAFNKAVPAHPQVVPYVAPEPSSESKPTVQPEVDSQVEASPVATESRIFLDPSVWKTFASPTTPYKLFGHPETGRLLVVPPGEVAPPSPWLQIPSSSAAHHLEIAREFISGLPDESHRQLLSQTLGAPRWWDAYFLTTQQLGLASAWTPFRRRRLIEEFESTLKRIGVPFTEYHKDHPPAQWVPKPGRPGRNWATANSETSMLRRLAAGAVQQMSTTELRELMLPLGYVVDQLTGG